MNNFKNNTYIEDSILEYAGGAHPDGEYAYVVLRKEIFDALEGGNKLTEERINLIRKDIYDREISQLRAEIERKDEALRWWLEHAPEILPKEPDGRRGVGYEEYYQYGVDITCNALSTKEDNDEKS